MSMRRDLVWFDYQTGTLRALAGSYVNQSRTPGALLRITLMVPRRHRREAERADRPVERYKTRIDPPDLVAGGATAREETQ
jgi:hypothetical protein